jgi:hypothetical protein
MLKNFIDVAFVLEVDVPMMKMEDDEVDEVHVSMMKMEDEVEKLKWMRLKRRLAFD